MYLLYKEGIKTTTTARKADKRLLNFKQSTSTAGVYGELGRFPLYITRYVRIIKYWCKICNSDNILIKTMYEVGLDNCNKGCIKKMLYNYGFANIFNEYGDYRLKGFPGIFKQRVIDNGFKQDWHSSLDNYSV